MPKVLLLAKERFSEIKHAFTDKQYQPEEIQELMCKLLEDVRNIREELAEYINSLSWNHPTFYDDDEEHSIQHKEYLENSLNAIAPVLPTEELEYSLSMGYEHLITTPETESDEILNSSVKNLVQIPREYEVTSDNESECDVPVCEYSSTFDVLKDHSEILSDSNNDDISSDDDAFEDIEYIQASLTDSELVSLEEENDGRLTSVVIKDISDNSTNDPLLEEVDLFLASDNSIPPGIENFDYDSEGDIHFLEELLSNDSIPLPKRELILAVVNNIDELNEDECFDPGEAWKRFKEMLRACPHHGFIKLTQIDTFYNRLNDNDQDSLNSTTGRNLLSKTTREALQIIKNKSKVRYSRNKPNVSRMNTTSMENASKTDDRIDKLADQISTLVDIVFKKVVTPATVKAVKESCVTCSGNHAYYNCDATNSNQSSVFVEKDTYNQVAHQNRARNFMAPPGFAPVQNNSQN
nr:hypothetical protein [Tanacetum cinerariifolium]